MLKINDLDYNLRFKTYVGSSLSTVVPKKKIVKDMDWAEQSLFSTMISDNFSPKEIEALYRTKAEYQDMSTAPGGHIAVNPPYGWHPNADPHYQGRLMSNYDSVIENNSPYIGLGRYYTEAIHSHIQPRMLTISAGVPDFKNIFSFYMGAVDSMRAIIAASGRSALTYMAVKTAVTVWGVWAAARVFPVLTVGYVLATTATKVVFGMTDPSYYSMKPTMDVYLSTAGQLLNSFAVERKILEVITANQCDGASLDDERLMTSLKVHRSDIEALTKLIPGIINDDGFINIFAIVGGYQRRRYAEIQLEAKYLNRHARVATGRCKVDTNKLKDTDSALTPEEYSESGLGAKDKIIKQLAEVSNMMTDALNDAKLGDLAESAAGKLDVTIPTELLDLLNTNIKPVYHDSNAHLGEFLELKKTVKTLKSRTYAFNIGGSDVNPLDPNTEDQTDVEAANQSIQDYLDDTLSYFTSGINDGVANVNFIVDYEGSTTDTFSNTMKEIPISSMVNGVSTTIRDARFSASGGNLLGGNIVGDVAKFILDKAADVSSGVIDGVTFGMSGLLRALTGNAHLTFPKMIGDSNADIGTHQFKIRLGGPYSNPLALMLDIDVALSLVFAMALPRAVGRAATTTPYIISAFLPGQVNIEKGVLTSLTVNRGVGSTQYTNDGVPTDLELRFTIADLDPIRGVPVPGTIGDAFEMALDDHAGMTRYIKSLSGQGFTDTRHTSRKAILRINRLYGTFSNYTNPAAVGTMLSQTEAGRLLSMIIPDTAALTSINN